METRYCRVSRCATSIYYGSMMEIRLVVFTSMRILQEKLQ